MKIRPLLRLAVLGCILMAVPALAQVAPLKVDIEAGIQGQVVDAVGRPFSHAAVMWADADLEKDYKSEKNVWHASFDERLFQSTRTDADVGHLTTTDTQGRFWLSRLPRGPITLWASDGAHFVAYTAQSGQDVQIKLPAPSAEAAKAQLKAKLWAQFSPTYFWWMTQYWDVFGDDQMRVAALRADGALRKNGTSTGQATGGCFDAYLQHLARQTPQDAPTRGVALLRAHPEALAGKGARDIALLAAASENEGAYEWAGQWFDQQKLRVSDQGAAPDAVANALAVWIVGSRIHRIPVRRYRDIALLLADARTTPPRVESALEWGRILWLGGQGRFEEVTSEWSKPVRMMATMGACDAIRTPEGAKFLIERLFTFYSDQEVKDWSEAAKSGWGWGWCPSSPEALSQGRARAMRALQVWGAGGTESTLDLLGGVNGRDWEQSLAFREARAQLKAGHLSKARQVARYALHDGFPGEGNLARMGAWARSFDPAMGHELLQKLRSEAIYLQTADTVNSCDSPLIFASYASALQNSDPGRGRLILEREWARLTPQLGQENKEDESRKFKGPMNSLIWAMANYDPTRALVWADQVDERFDVHESAQFHVLVSLIADDETRPLLKWNTNDEF